jgi:DNA-binding NarL/FixJ family response regulator
MSDPIRLLVADDQLLFRQGIVGLLEAQPDFLVVGTASDGADAIRLCREQHPDVVLMDIHMPGMSGVEATRSLKQQTDVRILILTVSDKDRDLLSALSAGADGYLLKNASPDELFQAIHRIAAGHGVLSPEITPRVMRAAATAQNHQLAMLLSEREYEILVELAKGSTTAEIGDTLFISENTVKTHIRHILQKLGAANRTQAVARAIELGLNIRP